jgi:hypothetical protein
MTVEQLPNFTPDARKRWETIPADVRPKLLANVLVWEMPGRSYD